MNRLFTSFCLLAFFIESSLADCPADPDVIGARYKVIVTQADGHGEDSYDLVLWRKGGQALHEYPEKKLADLWERSHKDQVRLVRHFDEFERAIEYQSGEISEGRTKGAWQIKRQLVTDDLLKPEYSSQSKGANCDKSVTFVTKNGDSSVQLEWLSELQLVKTMTEKRSDRTVELQLQETVTDPDDIETALNKRSNFMSTDYTDIGDNESDPFLVKMINLGFTGHSHH